MPPPRKLPPALYKALSDAGDRLQDIITCPSRKDAWGKVVGVLAPALKGQRAAVWGVERYWVVAERPPETIRLMQPDGQPCQLPLAPLEEGPDALLVRSGEAPEDSPVHELVARSFPPGTWAASLVLRLRDHKARLQGVTVIADPGRKLNRRTLQFATHLARKCGRCIEQGRALYLVTQLRRQMKMGPTFQRVLELILRYAISLVGADRGDIGYWNWDHDGGRGGFGLIPSEAPWLQGNSWQPCEPTGVLGRVWHDPHGRDFRSGRDESPAPASPQEAADPRSSLVVRLDQRHEQLTQGPRAADERRETRRIAVVRLESRGRADAFDDRDRELLHLLLDRACDDFKLVGLWMDFRQIIDRLSESAELEQTGKVILESIRAAYGFDCGLIYYPDYPGKKLVAFGMMGGDEGKRGWTLPLVGTAPETRSFALHLFREQAVAWVADPRDPAEWGKRVNREGVESFDINGPMIGLRLVGGREEPIGAMVLWCERNPPPAPWHQEELRPLGQLAGLALRAHLAQERQTRFQDAVGRILRQMRQTLDLKENLRAVMEGIRAVGFERVRIFAARPGGRLVGLCSAGMDRWAFENRPEDSPYVASIHPEDGKAYNEYVAGLVRRINQQQADLLAEVHPRPGDRPDPHSAELGKAPDTPWVDVPLVSVGKFYGELAADNRFTERPLTDTDKLYINVFGALAARAFAIDEKRGMLNAEAVGQLYRRAVLERADKALFRCLVHFLRHENGGLGFARALFLRADEDGRCFRFTDAAGQLDARSSREADRSARDRTLAVLFDGLLEHGAAARPCPADQALCAALAGYTVPYDSPAVQPCLRPQDTRRVPPVVDFRDEALLAVLGREAAPVAVAVFRPGALPGQQPLVGLLIAGRAWGRPLGDVDRAALATFAQEAGQLVLLRELYGCSLAQESLANFGLVTQALRREIRRPKNNLRIHAELLPRIAERLAPRDAETLAHVRQDILRLEAVTESVDSLAYATRELWSPVGVTDFLEELQARAEEEFQREQVQARLVLPEFPAGTRITVKKQALMLALVHLVRNACQAWKSPANDRAGDPGIPGQSLVIEVDLRVVGGRLEFHVTDNGPGMSEQTREQLEALNPVPRRDGQEMALGLLIVRRIASLHNGALGPLERLTPGVRVWFWCQSPVPPLEAAHARDNLDR
jgi:signal transduction histidine kinase